jgi:hypothetical protein
MCKQLVPSIKFVCHHELDAPAFLVTWDECGDCGEIKAGPEYLGQSTKTEPCDDCKEDGTYTQDASGRWVKA